MFWSFLIRILLGLYLRFFLFSKYLRKPQCLIPIRFSKKKNSLCAREMRLIRFLRVFIIAAEFKNEKKKAFELVLPKAHALSVDLSVTHVSGNFFFSENSSSVEPLCFGARRNKIRSFSKLIDRFIIFFSFFSISEFCIIIFAMHVKCLRNSYWDPAIWYFRVKFRVPENEYKVRRAAGWK